MNLLAEILLLPLAPVRTVRWIGEVVQDRAEQERRGDRSPSERLADIEQAYADGEISRELRDELQQQVLDEIAGEIGEG